MHLTVFVIKYKSVFEMLLKCIFDFQLNFEEGEGNEFLDSEDDDISFEVIIFKLIFFSKSTVYLRT